MPLITPSKFHSLITPFNHTHHLGTHLNTSTTSILLRVVNKDRFLGVKDLKKMKTASGILCKGSLESGLELGLEGEILEFMKSSRNPNEFPTKEELLDAGRSDLVDAIVKKGGWLSLGWDDEYDECGCDGKEFDDVRDGCCSLSHQCASSSGRSVETVIQEDAWLEGILYRLGEHRSLLFRTSMQEDGHCIYDSSKLNGGQRGYGLVDVATVPYSVDKSNSHEEIDSNDVNSQLQQMKHELSSSLRLLRFIKVTKTNNLPNDDKSSSSGLQRLPDIWIFHENEDFSVKDRLKSVCAELTVLEGKLASSIIRTQEIVNAKQRRTDDGCGNPQLHNVCIIWHDSASEVLLVGSVDGWTTQLIIGHDAMQRKMKKSEAGVFYLSLKLYPGRYEYKFIVDGVWRVDHLRPTVNKNGYENNVLIIPE